MRVILLQHTPNPDALVAMAGKICYSPSSIEDLGERLTQEEVDKFVKHLAEMKHESPIEHASFTFGVEGVSRVLSHQLVRHRIASYSQKSQRYVKHDQFEYIIPPAIEKIPKAKGIFIEAMKDDQKKYDELVDTLLFNYIMIYLLETGTTENIPVNKYELVEYFHEINKKMYSQFQKKAIEDARYVFPNACETKVIFTMNARTLKNFFRERCCNRAQWEIREMAYLMLDEVKKVAPNLFKNAGASCFTEGKCPEGAMSCGNPYRREV